MGEYLTRDKLLGIKNHKHFPMAVLILALFLSADLLFINYKLLVPSKSSPTSNTQSSLKTQLSTQSSSSSSSTDSCGPACIAAINKAVSEALATGSSSGGSSTNQTNEFFIPLGTGNGNSMTMTNIPGMQTYINGSAYGQIKQATFEVSMYIPTGNETAQIQLYNVTAGHVVWNSPVNFTQGGTPAFLVSQPITLDPGNNLYQVQMSTQLTFPAYITQANVHIITY